MMATLNILIKKASNILRISGQESSIKSCSLHGEVIYCKNNVCVHPPTPLRTEMDHHPGYLSIKAQHDDLLGSTLILSWIPNSTLKKNPRSLENRTPGSSPCRSARSSACPSPTLGNRSLHHSGNISPHVCSEKSLDEYICALHKTSGDQETSISSTISDLGSPKEDLGSLDSWTASDFTEATSPNYSQTSLETSDKERSDYFSCESSQLLNKTSIIANNSNSLTNAKSQSDSGIGPEEVIAALESMISEINEIDISCGGSKSNINSVTSGTDSGISIQSNDQNLSAFNKSNCEGKGKVTCKIHSEKEFSYNSSSSSSPENTLSVKTEKSKKKNKNLCSGKEKSKKKIFHLNLSEENDEVTLKQTLKTPTPDISISPKSGSSTTETTSNQDPESCPSSAADSIPNSPNHSVKSNFLYEGTPESLAHAHNLTFPETATSNSPSRQLKRESPCGIFSVDLSQMRSLRLFFSNKECTCGQLVIASQESQYKILHFHYGGLDRLANVFDDWNFLTKPKNKTDNCPYRQFSVCRPQVTAAECHPEEGIYGSVDEQTWREYMNDDGQIEDDFQLRKAIFFGGLDHKLRKEAWPFLLHYYNFQSTFDEREQVRNDKYIEYQAIRRRRDHMSIEEKEVFWKNVQCTVEKDVIRTDRCNPFFAGDDNPNIEIMKNILLNYALYNPYMGYTQGMSDLLAPILSEIRDEAESFWCFVGLMQRTIFVSSPKDVDMDINLSYLRELLRLMTSDFYAHLKKYPDSLELLFAHRWLLLCFKREFPEQEALRMWEACWAHYQTDYFYLFLCVSIIAIYGQDIIDQDLRADEMLLHFSSLAMHMNGDLVLCKARGLLHQFRLLPRIPCTLAKLCELCGPGMWDSGHVPLLVCEANHGNHSCPHGGQDPGMKEI